MNAMASWVVQPRNARLIIAFWVIGALLSLTQLRHLTVGDPTASTPLLRESSPYNQSHLEIQKYFGGIEPLIVVVEGRDKDVLKDPTILHTMEKFQRAMERDPDVGYSFSLSDIVQSINMTFYDHRGHLGHVNNAVGILQHPFLLGDGVAPRSVDGRQLLRLLHLRAGRARAVEAQVLPARGRGRYCRVGVYCVRQGSRKGRRERGAPRRAPLW